MGASIDAKPLLDAMRALKPVLELAALVDVRERAERIAARAKELAPVGYAEEGDLSPGALRDDIGVKGEGIDSKGPFVDVGTREPYGLYVEFGTVNMRPEPFMRPAIAEENHHPVSTRISLAPRKRTPKK